MVLGWTGTQGRPQPYQLTCQTEEDVAIVSGCGGWEQAGMSCVDITHDMATLLVALRSWPDVNLEALRAMPEWKLAQAWGWIMETGELTGSGHRHAGGEKPAGIVT